LMADYEHASLNPSSPVAFASAKKWTPVVRDGALWATDIKWTDRARTYIAGGEYRYFSIAAHVDAKSRRVLQMVNFALTNNPAANDINPLIAARIAASAPEAVWSHSNRGYEKMLTEDERKIVKLTGMSPEKFLEAKTAEQAKRAEYFGAMKQVPRTTIIDRGLPSPLPMGLSDAELQVCKLTGIKPEEFAAHRALLVERGAVRR